MDTKALEAMIWVSSMLYAMVLSEGAFLQNDTYMWIVRTTEILDEVRQETFSSKMAPGSLKGETHASP